MKWRSFLGKSWLTSALHQDNAVRRGLGSGYGRSLISLTEWAAALVDCCIGTDAAAGMSAFNLKEYQSAFLLQSGMISSVRLL